MVRAQRASRRSLRLPARGAPVTPAPRGPARAAADGPATARRLCRMTREAPSTGADRARGPGLRRLDGSARNLSPARGDGREGALDDRLDGSRTTRPGVPGQGRPPGLIGGYASRGLWRGVQGSSAPGREGSGSVVTGWRVPEIASVAAQLPRERRRG